MFGLSSVFTVTTRLTHSSDITELMDDAPLAQSEASSPHSDATRAKRSDDKAQPHTSEYIPQDRAA
ncbi:MAG: hypothetical protein AAGE80_03595 [Pseudomonadota bacterium]